MSVFQAGRAIGAINSWCVKPAGRGVRVSAACVGHRDQQLHTDRHLGVFSVCCRACGEPFGQC